MAVKRGEADNLFVSSSLNSVLDIGVRVWLYVFPQWPHFNLHDTV
ncbi:hypothetical protein [Shewanella putrefaciens]|nr:hypothetical protein [Shewanella putrefaciens]AVV85328.1 hypothetical protein SPWS13_3626 [Shewanella putrefaciens]